jgi:hypothetical protein
MYPPVAGTHGGPQSAVVPIVRNKDIGTVNDQLQEGLTILQCEVANANMSLQSPYTQANEMQQSQKQYRWNMFQTLYPESKRTRKEFEDSRFVFYPVGVGGKFNIPHGSRTLYHDSEIRPLEWKLSRENFTHPCVVYVFAIIESLLRIRNGSSKSPGALVDIINPNQTE